MVRLPHIALRPFVRNIWVSDHARPQQSFRERSLPDGCMHVVIRLSEMPIRIIDAVHPEGHDYGFAVIGGARASFYTREISAPTQSIGATLLPGASQALFRLSALELADRHTPLADILGNQANVLRDRLLSVIDPALQLELFEMYLMLRLPQVRGVHPAIAQALQDIRRADNIRMLVASSGVSHRRFVELFGSTVGLTPKRFARVLRFQRMLQHFSSQPGIAWADLAAEAGYSDQPHCNREFREFAAMSPEDYRKIAPESPGHVLISSDAKGKRTPPDRRTPTRRR
jgi:AraC-like DNA-binding protein